MRASGKEDNYHMWVLALVKADDDQAVIAAGCEAAAKYPDNADIQVFLALAFYG